MHTFVRSYKDPSFEYVMDLQKLGKGEQAEVFYAKKKRRSGNKETVDRVAVRVIPRG
jgi:serine/threonine protein kinase